MLSQRAGSVTPSSTLAINEKVKSMRGRGIDVVDFGIGEPDFDTPLNIKDAAMSAIRDGFTKYTPASGTDELKEAVCKKLEKDNNIVYEKNQIVVSCGAKQSLYNAMLALLGRGDEVIIPVPYWVSYAEQVKLADGIPVFARTDDFHIIPEEIEKNITEKTKIIILNSPCNPSGAVCPKEILQRVAEIALENDLYVISDEVYEKFVYDSNKHISIASLGDEVKERTITVNAVSKTYAMTGWRIGYTASSEEIAKAMAGIQSQTTSCPSSISQKASLGALTGKQDSIAIMVREFDKRRRFAHKRLDEIGMHCKLPEGAFYIFPAMQVRTDSPAFSGNLLDKAKVAVVPGADFGMDGHIRISYATSMKQLEEGMDRMEKVLKL